MAQEAAAACSHACLRDGVPARGPRRRALNLYLDSSALIKRYVDEPGSREAVRMMDAAERQFTCRITFVETFRAVSLAAGPAVASRFAAEWPAVQVIEVDAAVAERAGRIAVARRVRSLDAIHLAAATTLSEDAAFLTWDARLHTAARAEGLRVLPEVPA